MFGIEFRRTEEVAATNDLAAFGAVVGQHSLLTEKIHPPIKPRLAQLVNSLEREREANSHGEKGGEKKKKPVLRKEEEGGIYSRGRCSSSNDGNASFTMRDKHLSLHHMHAKGLQRLHHHPFLQTRGKTVNHFPLTHTSLSLLLPPTSISPVRTLKQAPCHGQTMRPPFNTPFSSGAPTCVHLELVA